MTKSTTAIEQFDDLLAFLPLFSGPLERLLPRWEGLDWRPDAAGVMTLPAPLYTDEVNAFFDRAAQPEWNDSGYDPDTARRMVASDAQIASATLDEVRTMLTYCVRGERFNSGHWAQMIREGRIAALLQRLSRLRGMLMNEMGDAAGGSEKAPKGKLQAQIVGNIGLYYCCYRLSTMGWNVMPTARNARGVDIIAYNRDATRFIGVQVKALSKRSPVPLGGTREKIMGDFWVIINRAVTQPTAFILLPQEVKERAHRGEKDGVESFWLQPKDYEATVFREAWNKIGTPDVDVPATT